ncbi:MAG TPA: hypothetical protein VEH05_04635 [Streptosporangiaceae bacterium]|nr:hypothetical protein [Streptosporangiaceae bacterium]
MSLPSISPGAVYSVMVADPWKPVGHMVEVDQVGVELSGPLAALSIRLPGCEPTPASATPAVRTATPAVMPISPRSATARRVVPAVRQLVIAERRVVEVI